MSTFVNMSPGSISGAELADLLYREVLSCELCHRGLELPPSSRTPKCLECAHYFCASCLEGYVEHRGIFSQITCPTCRSDSTVGSAGISGLHNDIAVIRTLSKLQSLNLTPREASKTADIYTCQLCKSDRMWYICLTCSSDCNRLCSACNAIHKDSVEFMGHRTVLADAESIGIADVVTTAMKPPSQLPQPQFAISDSSFILDNLYDHLMDDSYLLDPERPALPPGLSAPVFDTFNVHSGGNSSHLGIMSTQANSTTQNFQKTTNRLSKPLSDPVPSNSAQVTGRVVIELEDFPSHLIGALIGLEGARIKRIRQESGCRINVLKTPGSIHNGNTLIATIEYAGTPEAILSAKTLVSEVKLSKIQEMSSDPTRVTDNDIISVPPVGVGLAMSEQHPPLLRRASSSSIIDDEMDVELASMFAFLEGISPSIRASANGPILVTTTGHPDSFIDNLMQLRGNASSKEMMMLNLRMLSEEVGKLMGPKGGRIRNLQKVSGCKAFVYKSVDNLKTKDCCLLIKGPANKMVGAVFLVSDILCRPLCRFPEDFNIEDFEGYSRFTNHTIHHQEDSDGTSPPNASLHHQQQSSLVAFQYDVRSIRMEIAHGDLSNLIGPRGDSITAFEKSHNCQIKLVKSVSGQEIDQNMSFFDVVGHPDNVASVITSFQAILGKKVKVSELYSVASSDEEIKIRNGPYVSKSAMALSQDSLALASGGSSSKIKAAKVNQDESSIRKFVSMDSMDALRRFDSSDSVESTSEFMLDSGMDAGDGLLGDSVRNEMEDSSNSDRVYVPRGSAPPTMVTAVIQCPIDAVGHLIGLRGSNLKRLCKISGCKIIIDEAVKGQNYRLVNVRGQASCVTEAVAAVEESIRERALSNQRSSPPGMARQQSVDLTLPSINSAQKM